MLGLYSETSGPAWGSMSPSAWRKSSCWANSQAEVSTNSIGWRSFPKIARARQSVGVVLNASLAAVIVPQVSRRLNPAAVQTSLGFLLFPPGAEKELNNNHDCDEEEGLKSGRQETTQRARIVRNIGLIGLVAASVLLCSAHGGTFSGLARNSLGAGSKDWAEQSSSEAATKPISPMFLTLRTGCVVSCLPDFKPSSSSQS